METFSVFVKLAEDARRERALRVALGEEKAKLNLPAAQHFQQGGQKKWGNQQQHKQGGGFTAVWNKPQIQQLRFQKTQQQGFVKAASGQIKAGKGVAGKGSAGKGSAGKG